MDHSPPGSSVQGISQARITGMGCHFLLQGIFQTLGSNSHLLHWQADSLPFWEAPKCILLLFSHSVMSNSLCPMECSTPGFPVLHCLPEFTQTHVHWVGDANQPTYPLLPLLLPPSIFPSIRVFSNGSALPITWQSTGVSAVASVLPMNIQDWFPSGWTGLISFLFKGLSRVFSRTTVWKHQSFGAQPSLWSNSNVYTWLLSQHLIESLDRYRILG